MIGEVRKISVGRADAARRHYLLMFAVALKLVDRRSGVVAELAMGCTVVLLAHSVAVANPVAAGA